MEDYMFVRGDPHGRTDTKYLTSTSVRDVRYSCGYCGYELNLSSSNRNMATIGSKYSKSIRRGVISFLNVDESRFTLVDEFRCIPIPYFSKHSWGLFRRRTKLLCRKCGHSIGIAYRQDSVSDRFIETRSPASDQVSTLCNYNVRIRALQPSSSEDLQIPRLIQ